MPTPLFRFMQSTLIILFSFLLASCGGGKVAPVTEAEQTVQQTFQWKMVTSWPKNFPGLGRAPETFAKYVEKMSGGRLKVKVYGAGELVPGFEVFDSVSQVSYAVGYYDPHYFSKLFTRQYDATPKELLSELR